MSNKHPQEDLLVEDAGIHVSKRTRVAHTKTFYDMISNLALPCPCNLAEIPLFVTGTSSSGEKVLLPIGIYAYATAPLSGPQLHLCQH
jgi:hypothetical protein